MTNRSMVGHGAAPIWLPAVLLAMLPLQWSGACADDAYREFDGKLTDMIPSLYGGDGILLNSSTTFSHAAHFLNDSLEKFNNLSLSVRDLSFPVVSPQAGVKFRYDPVMDEFVPVTESLGASAFVFDADTVGRGNLHLGLAYSRRSFKTLEGDPLDGITVDLHHADLGENGPDLPCLGGEPGACYAFERDVVRLSIDLELQEQMFALTGAYGLTDRLEAAFLLPVLQTRMRLYSSASVIENPTAEFFDGHLHEFGGTADSPVDALSATRTGLGDTVFRLNYWALKADADDWNLSVGTDIRLPTGDNGNLQGLPGIGLRPRLALSRDLDFLGGNLKPHLNAAYGFGSGLNHEQTIEYALGASYTRSLSGGRRALAISADFLGKNIVHNKDGFGDQQYDLALGLRLYMRKRVSFYYSVLLPMNRAGLRPDAQHLVGLQAKF